MNITLRRKRGLIALLTSATLILGLTGCDLDAEYTTEKTRARVDYNVFTPDEGASAFMTVTVSNKTSTAFRAEIDLADGGTAPNAWLTVPAGESRAHTFTDINFKKLDTEVWTKIMSTTSTTALEWHNRGDINFDVGDRIFGDHAFVQAYAANIGGTNKIWVKVRDNATFDVDATIILVSQTAQEDDVVDLATLELESAQSKAVEFTWPHRAFPTHVTVHVTYPGEDYPDVIETHRFLPVTWQS
jgi:hypothetical protein